MTSFTEILFIVTGMFFHSPVVFVMGTIGGGSSGVHIALLAAYGHEQAQLRPADLEGTDLSATYYHTCQYLTSRSALGKNKK